MRGVKGKWELGLEAVNTLRCNDEDLQDNVAVGLDRCREMCLCLFSAQKPE